MTEGRGTNFGLNAPIGLVSRTGAAVFASKSRLPRSPPTPLLRHQQSSSDDVQIGEGSGHFQSVQVLRQATIADFAEAKDILGLPVIEWVKPAHFLINASAACR
jgi:hypothetical protein